MKLPASAFTAIESGWLEAGKLKGSKVWKKVYHESCELLERGHGKAMNLYKFMVKCNAPNALRFDNICC